MRLTTDTPKNNLEMALNLFYVKDEEVWVRGYGKNGADISLFDMSRGLTRWNCPYVDLDISDDSFSMMMAEWLWEDVESFEHVLALLYQAAWVCAELREHLKQFEDTGLTPEEIKAPFTEDAMINLAAQALGVDPSRLRELAEADKDGRVVVLPCKVGDTVWANLDGMRHTRKCVIEFVNIGSHVTTIVFSTVDGLREQYGVNPSSFGKTVFLTREEAEKALQEMEGKKDG